MMLHEGEVDLVIRLQYPDATSLTEKMPNPQVYTLLRIQYSD